MKRNRSLAGICVVLIGIVLTFWGIPWRRTLQQEACQASYSDPIMPSLICLFIITDCSWRARDAANEQIRDCLCKKSHLPSPQRLDLNLKCPDLDERGGS